MKRSLLALPVVLGVAGATLGWFTRPDDTTTRPDAPDVAVPTELPAPAGGPIAATLPISTDGLVLSDDAATLTGAGTIGTGEALRLPLTVDAAAAPAEAPAVVDPATGEPLPTPPAPAPDPALPPFPISDGSPADTAPSEESPDTTDAAAPEDEPIGATGAPAFVDPCVRAASGCPSGLPGVVLDPLEGRLDERILPIDVSQPFAAVGPFARACAEAERDTAPDPDLFPSQRPTVAVLVNRPVDLRLTGTWPDGSTIEPMAMRISADHRARWQAALDAGQGQGTLIACGTVPRAVVEAHAEGRIAPLQAEVDVVAGEASYRTGARVELNVPANADQIALATPRLTSLGEVSFNGLRYPAVNVHVEYLLVVPGEADAANPTGTPPTGTTTHMSAGFVTRGGCAAWGNGILSPDAVFTTNRQVVPFGNWETRTEQRTVNGRPQQVQIVDLQILGDYDMESGWEGDVCVGLWSGADRTPIGLWAATGRAPRSPEFQVSVGMGDLNADWRVEVEFPCRTQLSNGFLDDGTATGVWGRAGADCGLLSGRWLADGIPVRAYVVDRLGVARQPFVTRIPVNLEYCNTDDPWSAIVGGCDQSVRLYEFDMPLGSGYPQPDAVLLSVRVERRAEPGINLHVDPDPSHQWRIGPVERIG